MSFTLSTQGKPRADQGALGQADIHRTRAAAPALTNSRAVVERLVSDAKSLGYIDSSFLDERLRVVTIE